MQVPISVRLRRTVVPVKRPPLSTFVVISQNRAEGKRQVIADQEWRTVQEEDSQNEELLKIANQILDLTKQVHAYASAREAAPPTE